MSRGKLIADERTSRTAPVSTWLSKRRSECAGSGIPRFQVAFSFPGKYRELVRKIADKLAQQYGKSRVLFDEFHTTEFARPNLDTHLQELYFNRSQLVVVFLCAAYDKSQWSGLEWRAIRIMIKQHRERLRTANSGILPTSRDFLGCGVPSRLRKYHIVHGKLRVKSN